MYLNFPNKKCVTTAIELYENDKLDEEDVLEIFHQSEVHN